MLGIATSEAPGSPCTNHRLQQARRICRVSLSYPGFATRQLPPEFSGGAIIESASGKVRVDKTLEEEFAAHRNELRKKIYAEIFS